MSEPPSAIPFSRPWIDEEDIQRVSDTLRSGWWTTGSMVRQFETEFAEYVGSKHAVAVNSCTAALHLALAALDVVPGDLVVTSTFTFAATAEVIAYMNAIPVLLDVEASTMNISAAQFSALCEALSADAPEHALRIAVSEGRLPTGVLRSVPRGASIEQLRAVVPVHFAGQACDMDPILAMAQTYGIKVIEDAAHAVEATYRGRHAGTLGEVGAFSFYATKNLSTGEGGMATTDDDGVAERMRRLSLHGISKDAWKRYTAAGTWRYDIVEPGFKYNMTDISAALGVGQLSRIDRLYGERIRVVQEYDVGLSGTDGLLLPQAHSDGVHAWHLYVVRVKDTSGGQHRDRFIEELRARGVGTSVHFIPLHLHSYYREKYGYVAADYPVANAMFGEVVSLPLYPSLSDQQVARVVSAAREAIAAVHDFG